MKYYTVFVNRTEVQATGRVVAHYVELDDAEIDVEGSIQAAIASEEHPCFALMPKLLPGQEQPVGGEPDEL